MAETLPIQVINGARPRDLTPAAPGDVLDLIVSSLERLEKRQRSRVTYSSDLKGVDAYNLRFGGDSVDQYGVSEDSVHVRVTKEGLVVTLRDHHGQSPNVFLTEVLTIQYGDEMKLDFRSWQSNYIEHTSGEPQSLDSIDSIIRAGVVLAGKIDSFGLEPVFD